MVHMVYFHNKAAFVPRLSKPLKCENGQVIPYYILNNRYKVSALFAEKNPLIFENEEVRGGESIGNEDVEGDTMWAYLYILW